MVLIILGNESIPELGGAGYPAAGRVICGRTLYVGVGRRPLWVAADLFELLQDIESCDDLGRD
jgi:hypothetical protein